MVRGYKVNLPIIYGEYGDELIKEVTISPLPLGQLMVLPDGRRYVRAQIMSIPKSSKYNG